MLPMEGTCVRAGQLEIGVKRKDPDGPMPRTGSEAARQLVQGHNTLGGASGSGPTAKRPQAQTCQGEQLPTCSTARTHTDVRRKQRTPDEMQTLPRSYAKPLRVTTAFKSFRKITGATCLCEAKGHSP